MSVATVVNRLPSPLRGCLMRAAAVLPPSWRQSTVYRQWREFLAEAQYWPAERIQQWQLEQVRVRVAHAIKHTEGYRELYRAAGVRAEDIRSAADVRRLPFTTREMFQENLAAFTVRRAGARYVTTGGSTGIPFGFYEEAETAHIERAFVHAGWSRAGWKEDERSAVLRGAFVGTAERFSEYDPYQRELALSSYYLSPQTVAGYVAALKSAGVRVLQAYPSSLNLFCDLVREQGLEGELRLEVVLLGSENLYEWQLEKFRRLFPGASFHAWYGHCEKAVLAAWCEGSQTGHCWPFYGLTEVLGAGDRQVSEGEEGEIVGTSFHQRLTPFIRYRTLDRAVKGPAACGTCGRNFPILARVTGRSQEVIVTRKGRHISMTAINMHDDTFDSLRQFQFRQERAGEVSFLYVPKSGALAEPDRAKIERKLLAKLGEDITLALVPVAEIPRTRSGKLRFLDQRLAIPHGDS